MKTFNYIASALVALSALAMTSCRSSKHMTDGDGYGEVTTVTTPTNSSNTSSSTSAGTNSTVAKPSNSSGKYVAPDFATPANPWFTAKVKVTVAQGTQDITTTGTLRMHWNDVVQLTLSDPVLGITEVGRIELSADDMMIIDRINKRYVKSPYNDITAMRDKGIDFAALQATFWSEASQKNTFSFTMPGSNLKLDMTLSDKGNASKWETHSTVSSKYVKTDANKLLKSLIK